MNKTISLEQLPRQIEDLLRATSNCFAKINKNRKLNRDARKSLFLDFILYI